MAKISKQTKLKAIQEYLSSDSTQKDIIKRYGSNKRVFEMLLAAYKTYGLDVLFNPPKITAEF